MSQRKRNISRKLWLELIAKCGFLLSAIVFILSWFVFSWPVGISYASYIALFVFLFIGLLTSRCPYCGRIGAMGMIGFSMRTQQCKYCGAEEGDPFPQNHSKRRAVTMTVVMWLALVIVVTLLLILRAGTQQSIKNEFLSVSLREMLVDSEMHFGTALNDETSIQDTSIQKKAAAYLLKGSFDKQVDMDWVGKSFNFGECDGWPTISVTYKELLDPSKDWSTVEGWGFLFLTEEKQEALGCKSDTSKLVLASYRKFEVREGVVPSVDIREDYQEYYLYLIPADAHAGLLALLGTNDSN